MKNLLVIGSAILFIALTSLTSKNVSIYTHMQIEQRDNFRYLSISFPQTLDADVMALHNIKNGHQRMTAFFERFDYVAVWMSKHYKVKIYPSIQLAAGALESASGKSKLAYKYNNYFGIKARGKSKKINLPTKECYPNCFKTKGNFRIYDSAWESFAAYNQLLSKPRYRDLFNGTNMPWDIALKLGPKTKDGYDPSHKYYKTAPTHVLVFDPKSGKKYKVKNPDGRGYATDPGYPAKLQKIISDYGLQQLDLNEYVSVN